MGGGEGKKRRMGKQKRRRSWRKSSGPAARWRSSVCQSVCLSSVSARSLSPSLPQSRMVRAACLMQPTAFRMSSSECSTVTTTRILTHSRETLTQSPAGSRDADADSAFFSPSRFTQDGFRRTSRVRGLAGTHRASAESGDYT